MYKGKIYGSNCYKLVVAINKALEQAENLSQTEMAAMTKNMFGDLGGLFGG